MRLLITTDTVGGVWTFTQELVRGLLDRDCAVCLVSLGRKPSPNQQRACDTLMAQFSDRFLYVSSSTPLEWMEANGRAFTEAAPLLIALATQFRADLLHSNQFCFGALELPIPKIVTAHSDVLSWAQFCLGQTLPDSQWLRQYVSLVQAGLAGTDAVVAPTQWMMQALGGAFALPERTSVIANGRSIPPANRKPRLLQAVTAGRLWDPAKDLFLLQKVKSPMPILVAGETEYESSSRSCELDHAQLLGTISEEQIVALFQQSAVYLCTSRYEPFGLAPLEAALCGCAVLARDIPSLHEVWQDGALYFDDAASLSMMLMRLFNTPHKLYRMQRLSWERGQFFTRDRMTEQYLTFFERALSRDRESARVA